MIAAVIGVMLIGLWLVIRRQRRLNARGVDRTFMVEPPAGRLGRRKGERL